MYIQQPVTATRLNCMQVCAIVTNNAPYCIDRLAYHYDSTILIISVAKTYTVVNKSLACNCNPLGELLGNYSWKPGLPTCRIANVARANPGWELVSN